ncbi:DUF6894 family protein [Methylobacterium durans]|uniref:DUF6894 domain-containing protein n=1 Tax=Methylobacterium durans TaxID=2202825 RepID=A0A2U8W6L3_9HYPH|nr:hypothetical protein [Methylobacterium durans]AWN41717.1 hypothetical protein DK389_15875 [Methylobacterium durans]
MARYFFDVHEAHSSIIDHEGVDCAEVSAVSEEALRALCEIAIDNPRKYLDQKLRIIVRDPGDEVVVTASLGLSLAWHAEDADARAA